MDNSSTQKIKEIVLQLGLTHNKVNTQFNQWKICWKKIDAEMKKESFDPSLLKEQQIHLKNWVQFFPEKQGDFLLLMQFIDNNYSEYVSRYSAPFREWCKIMNYYIEGEFPKYTIDAFVDVIINQESNQAMINGKKVKSIALETIKSIIKKEYANIWERQTDLVLLSEKLKNGYLDISEKSPIKNDYIPVKSLHKELQKLDKKYTQKMFSADISRIIENGYSQFELAPIKNPDKAILVFNRKTQEKVYRGLIKF